MLLHFNELLLLTLMSIDNCLNILEQINDWLGNRITNLVQNARYENHHCQGEESEREYKVGDDISDDLCLYLPNLILNYDSWENDHECICPSIFGV